MALLEERLVFNGGDADTELRSVDNGDYLLDETYNIRIYDTDKSSTGIVKNIKGNNAISFQLPNGINKCICSFSDKNTGDVYYFIKNSLGNHGIYKFSQPNVIKSVFVDSILNFTDDLINHVNLVDGKLLYWTNKANPPRKINVVKALEDKNREYTICFGSSSGTGETYTFTLRDPSGAVVNTWSITVPIPIGDDADAFYASHYISSNSPSVPVDFVSDGGILNATILLVGKYTLDVTCSVANQVMAIASNFYPTPTKEDFIDRIKYPPTCQPTAKYKIDSSRKTNFVKNKIFQFAIQYVYDDNEFSSLSPISILPQYENLCSANVNYDAYNYIEVDFTETRLNDPSVRSIIKYVNICFREHNSGEFKKARTLTVDEFGIGQNIFRFYNDGLYPGISNSVASTLYSSVPILSGAQEFIGKKLVDSNFEEGYDNVPVDVKLDTSYDDTPPLGFTIRGSVAITSNDGLGQPIMRVGTMAETGFGGIMSSSTFVNNVDTDYFQKLPLYGFVFYLAGTDYYGISKQANTGLSFQDPVTKELVISSPTFLTQTWNYLNTVGFNSQWEINNIPPGRYSLRVASHFTTQADLLSGNRKYQEKSTTVKELFGQGVAGTGKTEAIIEIDQNGSVTVYNPVNLATMYTSSNGTLNMSFIEDISYGREMSSGITESNMCIMGYLVDSEAGANIPTSPDTALALERVTQSNVKFEVQTPTIPFTFNKTTDHNGFFFYAFRRNGGSTTTGGLQLNVLEYQNAVVTLANTMQLHDINNFSTTFWTNPFAIARFGFSYYNNASFTQNGRTLIKGRALNNGQPQPGINVCMPYHAAKTTDSNGDFVISYYDNFTHNDFVHIFASSTGLCFYDINSITPNNAVIPISASGYNNTNTFNNVIIDVTLTSLTTASANSLKRGGDWQFGIVYYDRGLRSTTVNANEKGNLHVNFYTEPDSNGNMYPSGIPHVSYKIRHLPPSWATHWQWVRTKNKQLNYALIWAAESVRYTDKPTSSGATVTYTSGSHLAIKLSNITSYYNENGSSLVAYEWQPGDRIRFISTANGTPFSSYNDFEIVNGDTTSNEIFIVNNVAFQQVFAGVVFEVYTPRPKTENNIFFEIGECYEVKESNGIKYHATDNVINDQNPLDPYNTPATGIIKTGDAYYRFRRIPVGANHQTIFIDDQSQSDFYSSKDDNIGRINILDLNFGRKHRGKTLRWSGDYVSSESVNNLSWNLFNDTEDILKGEGDVNKLQRAGRVLLAMQASQINSVYIYESQFLDNVGQQNVIKSDGFIGGINPLRKASGTIHPESVKEWEGDVYYYDEMNGISGRYANDGITPISDYKAVSYFKDKAKTYSGLVMGFIDPKNKEYGLTFGDETIIFCDQERSKRWISKYNFAAENYSYSNMELVSFKDGVLWVHERNPIRNNFYGVQYPSKIAIVSNENNSKMRQFMALCVDGSHLWFCPNNGDISIPPSEKYPNGMSSRLLKTKFRNIGTDWYSPFMKDLNSPNMISPQDALINGRDLIGHAIKIILTNDSTEEVTLKSASVRYVLIDYTKK